MFDRIASDGHLTCVIVYVRQNNVVVLIKQMFEMPQILDDNDCTLAYYGVVDGGEIVVHDEQDSKKHKNLD